MSPQEEYPIESQQPLGPSYPQQILAVLTHLRQTIVSLEQVAQGLQSIWQSQARPVILPDYSPSSTPSSPSKPRFPNLSMPEHPTTSKTVNVSQGTLFPPTTITYTSPFPKARCSCHSKPHPPPKTKE